MLKEGIKGAGHTLVCPENTAAAMGSGTLRVFATPALVALAEKTCWSSIQAELEPGQCTVGTQLDLRHTAPTPVGMTVHCGSELIGVEGRSLTFRVQLWDETGAVGSGTHQRVVVDETRFQAKADGKGQA